VQPVGTFRQLVAYKSINWGEIQKRPEAETRPQAGGSELAALILGFAWLADCAKAVKHLQAVVVLVN
jgi:hypothetical protein